MAVLKILSNSFKECPGSVHSICRDVLVDVMEKFLWFPCREHKRSIWLGPQSDPGNVFPLKIYGGNNHVNFIPGYLNVFSNIPVGIEFKSLIADHDFSIIRKTGKWSSLDHEVSFVINRLNQTEVPFQRMNRSYHNLNHRLKDSNQMSADTNEEQGDDDNDWRNFLLQQPAAEQSQQQRYKTRNQVIEILLESGYFFRSQREAGSLLL